MVRSIDIPVKGLIPRKPSASKDFPVPCVYVFMCLCVYVFICRTQAWLYRSQTLHALRVKKPADAGLLNKSQVGATRL
jgi:hypothetical protein